MPWIGRLGVRYIFNKDEREVGDIELDGIYVDTALKRLADATGLVPTLAGDGRTFDEIRAERHPETER